MQILCIEFYEFEYANLCDYLKRVNVYVCIYIYVFFCKFCWSFLCDTLSDITNEQTAGVFYNKL